MDMEHVLLYSGYALIAVIGAAVALIVLKFIQGIFMFFWKKVDRFFNPVETLKEINKDYSGPTYQYNNYPPEGENGNNAKETGESTEESLVEKPEAQIVTPLKYEVLTKSINVCDLDIPVGDIEGLTSVFFDVKSMKIVITFMKKK
jgi:hypothetical protein